MAVDTLREPDPGAAGDGSPWEPIAVDARYPPPRRSVDPDTRKGWIRRILPVLTAHRALLWTSIAAALVAMGAQVAVPAVTKQAIDAAVIEQDHALAPYVWALVALALLRGGLALYYRYGLGKLAYDVEYDLRQLLYRHLTLLSFSFYDRVQSGQIISRANSDIRSVTMLTAFAPLMAMSLLSFAVALAYMLTIHVPLTLLAVVCLPGVYALGVVLRNRSFPLSWVSAARVSEIASMVDENIAGVRVVKGFAAEQRQINELAGAARRLRWANEATVDARARYGPIMENLPRLGLALVLLYGGILAIDGEVTVGTLFAFNAYVLLMQAPFRMLGFFLMLGQRARASAERIFELVDEPVAIADRPGAVDLLDPRWGRGERSDGRDVGCDVRFDDVTFRYSPNGLAVLDGFTLHVRPGETVALVGATGSGKSTVARLLARFYEPESGSVSIDGHDVADLTLVSLRHALGIVLDEPFLFSTSVRDNIAYARPQATDAEVEAAAVAAQAHGFVSELGDGYDTVVGERGYTLSGGQRQRIAIARTLLAAPRVLVLDDATSAIDVQVEERIHRALGELLADRTTIVIAHRLSTIALADRVALLDGGRVVAEGTHAGLLATEPRYAAVLASIVDDADQAEVLT